jgi:hypothetical protein
MAQDIPLDERIRRFEAGQGVQPPSPNEIPQVPPVGLGVPSTQDRGLVDSSIFGTLADKSLQMDPRFWNEGGGFAGYQIPWFMVKGKPAGKSMIPEFIRKRLFRNLGWKGKLAGLALPSALHGIESIVQDNPFGRFGVHESNPEEADRRRDLAVETALWEGAGGLVGGGLSGAGMVRRKLADTFKRSREAAETGGRGIYGDISGLFRRGQTPPASAASEAAEAAGKKATPSPKPTETPKPKPKDRQRGAPDTTPRPPRLDRMVGRPEAAANVADFLKQVSERDLPLGGTQQAGRHLAAIVKASSARQIKGLLTQAKQMSPEFYTKIFNGVMQIGNRLKKDWASIEKLK